MKALISGIVNTNGEKICTRNGQTLREFRSLNSLKITNTFFRHKEFHKTTWSARGRRYIIDYVQVNKKKGSLVRDVRVYRGYDVDTDHFLLISKILIHYKYHYSPVNKTKAQKEVFRGNLRQEDGITHLYQQRMDQLLREMPESQNINVRWNNLKCVIFKQQKKRWEKGKREEITVARQQISATEWHRLSRISFLFF